MGLRSSMEWLARALALAGGLVLVVITILTCVSIAGRAMIPLGLGPVPGDFELVEAAAGFAVFSFLPWCQISRGHAAVDLFTSFLPDGANRFIDVVAELAMTIVLFVIAWRLAIGTEDKLRYGETTFILQFPVWWAYAASLVGALAGCVVSVYVLYERVRELVTGRSDFGPATGAIH